MLRAHGRNLDARSSCSGAAELAGADLESQFAMLESGSGVDDELAALRQMCAAANTPKINLITTILQAIRWSQIQSSS